MSGFPYDREEKRRVLMDAVESVRATLEAGAEESERIGTLAAGSVDALYESGLLRLKMPHVLGGAEADVVTQLDVLEAVSRMDPASGWCLMIGAASLGSLGAFLPDSSIEDIFVGGKPPKVAGAAAPTGTATPVDGGYRLTGRWQFGSGIQHAEWVSAGARVAADAPAGYPRQLRVVMPRDKVKVHDNWQVMGLRGTGSCDFSVDDLFVPDGFAWDSTLTEPRRGGALYRLGRPGYVTNEHSAFALGVARRALDAVTDVATSKMRGYNSVNLLANRPVFQRALGECDLRLRAARSLNVEILEEAWRSVCARVRDLYHGCRGRRGVAGVPVRRGRGPVHFQHTAAVPAGHQRGGAAPDGERHGVREPRAVPAGAARREGDGIEEARIWLPICTYHCKGTTSSPGTTWTRLRAA